MKIAFFELEDWEKRYIKQNLKGHNIVYFANALNANSVSKIKNISAIACFIYSRINKYILDRLPNLKFIATMSTGYDHIDTEECKKRGIKISNVSSYGGNTVAEHTFGLILALSRKLNRAIERTKEDNFSLKDLMGFDLKDKVIGVVGVGHIGRNVINIAKGFGMKVIAHSKNRDKKLCKELGFEWVNFDYILKYSDIISFHLPLSRETKHMINMKNIKKLKKGVFIINTSRGDILDTSALLYGFERKIIAGAGLDVLEGEANIKEERSLLKNRNKKEWETFLQNHILLKNNNVIVTPHSAFYTKEALERVLKITIDNLNAFAIGKIINEAG